MDTSGKDRVGIVAKMTVEGAARGLGIKEESVRKRVRRGKMRSEKGADGRLYVYVDSAETVRDGYRGKSTDLYTDRSVDEPTDAAREMIEAKDETIRILNHQLQEEREARRRADAIIVLLTQLNATLAARVPELEAPPTEPPDIKGAAVATAGGCR